MHDSGNHATANNNGQIEVRPFHRLHLEQFAVQQHQDIPDQHVDDVYLDLIEQNDSYTVLQGGMIIGCAGFIELDSHRGECWTIIGERCRNNFLAFHRVAKGS